MNSCYSLITVCAKADKHRGGHFSTSKASDSTVACLESSANGEQYTRYQEFVRCFSVNKALSKLKKIVIFRVVSIILKCISMKIF